MKDKGNKPNRLAKKLPEQKGKGKEHYINEKLQGHCTWKVRIRKAKVISSIKEVYIWDELSTI